MDKEAVLSKKAKTKARARQRRASGKPSMDRDWRVVAGQCTPHHHYHYHHYHHYYYADYYRCCYGYAACHPCISPRSRVAH